MAVNKSLASSSLAEVIDRILDKGVVVDAFVRIALVGIELISIEARVVIASVDGRLYLLRLADGKRVWSYDVGQPLQSSPAVAGGMIVVGCNDGAVYAFGAAK